MKCKGCGNDFKKKSYNQKYCSVSCRDWYYQSDEWKHSCFCKMKKVDILLFEWQQLMSRPCFSCGEREEKKYVKTIDNKFEVVCSSCLSMLFVLSSSVSDYVIRSKLEHLLALRAKRSMK